MQNFQLKRATRKQVKLKLNISAPSGAGKTMSALLMAYGLTGDWTKIALIDTENGSGSLYEHLGEYNVIDLAPPFSPERYIGAIDACIKGGIELIIIDSSTHEWNGPGGCIDINEQLAQSKYRNNTWSAWNETTPRHDAFVTTVLQAPVHIITCTRSKMETVMGDDKKVKKVGMKDMQREGWEYELTVSLNIDRDTHKAIASKDRTELFEGKDPFIITSDTGRMLKSWCETGVDTAAEEKKLQQEQAALNTKNLKDALKELKKCKSWSDFKLIDEVGESGTRHDEKFRVPWIEGAFKAVETLDELKDLYLLLTPIEKATYGATKDKRKAELQQPA